MSAFEDLGKVLTKGEDNRFAFAKSMDDVDKIRLNTQLNKKEVKFFTQSSTYGQVVEYQFPGVKLKKTLGAQAENFMCLMVSIDRKGRKEHVEVARTPGLDELKGERGIKSRLLW